MSDLNSVMNFFTKLFLCVALLIALSSCELIYGPIMTISCSTQPGLTISPEDLTPGQIETSYDAEIVISGGATPVGGVYLESGDLPKGLKIEHTRGTSSARLTGIPSQAGKYSFSIGAYTHGTQCTGKSKTREYMLEIKAP